MSPIGRVFIVLNLGLAFAFVAFAGTHLQHATDWKTRFETLEESAKNEKKQLQDQLEAAQQRLASLDLRVNSLDSAEKSKTAQLDEARAENQKLADQLNSIEGSFKTMDSSVATVADQIKAAVDRADQAYKLAMEASAREHEAKDKQVEAEDQLRQTQSRLAELEGQLGDRNMQIAKLQEEAGELSLAIEAFKRRFPGAFVAAVPNIDGHVTTVGPNGRLVTVEVTAKDGDPKPGHSLAIYSGSTYKGEMVVDTVEGNFILGRMTAVKDGAVINAGDKASSNLGGGGR